MSLTQYIGIEKPEQKKNIEVTTNPKDAFSSAFRIWAGYANTFPEFDVVLWKGDVKNICDILPAEAEKVSIALPRILKNAYFFNPIEHLSYKHYEYAGLFYTALLNNGTIDTLIVSEKWMNVCFWGYGLRRGCIKIAHTDGLDIGRFANGGMIISKGDSEYSIGQDAHNGIFINRGRANNLGGRSSGGVFINMGRTLNVDIASATSDFLFISYGGVRSVYNGLLMNPRIRRLSYIKPFVLHEKKIVPFSMACATLQNLLAEMKHATTGYSINEQKVYTLAEKIKGCLHGD